MRNIIKKIIAIKISSLLIFQQTVIAGSIVVDNLSPLGNQATVEAARNNVPVVNIVSPNTQGLSHNKFSDYNVNKEGVILNNSNQRDVNTQLSGYIYGNKNLAGGSTAQTILNEVTSKNKSELRGFTEVAGNRANVVVANPNGIYINGAGFINTSKATITTGKINIENNQIKKFEVREGEIQIDGEGLNTTNVDKSELYAKTVKLNAQIHAKDIDIVTGKNKISEDGTIEKIDEVDSEKPSFSLDSSSLGGIYANKINLIGTQAGVGVNLPIEIAAQDNLKLSADGKIILDKVISQKSIEINSTSSDVNTNNIYGNNVKIEAKNELNNKDIIASKTNINLKATKIVNENLIASGVDETLKDSTNGNLTINSENLENKKTLYAKDNITINSTNIKNSKNSNINSKKTIAIKSKNIENEDNVTIQANNIDINANNFNGKSLYMVALNGDLKLDTNNLNLTGDNLSKGLLYSTNDILISSKNFISNYLNIQANNNIDINSLDLTLNNSSIQSVVYINDIYENGYKQGNINLISNKLALNNTSLSSKDLNIKNQEDDKLEKLIVNNSLLDVNNDINILTSNFNTTNSTYLALRDVFLLSDSIKDDANDTIFSNSVFKSGNSMNITIDDDISLDSTNSFEATNSIFLNSKSLINSAEFISNNNITINTSDYLVNNALLSSGNIITLNANNYIINNDSNKALFGIRGAFTNLNTNVLTNYGLISSLYTMNIKANDIVNYGGIASGNVDNYSSVMSITANNLTNYNTIYSNDSVNLFIKNNLLNKTDNNIVNLGNQNATIFATNNITIQGDEDKTFRTQNIINDKSIIQTNNGDINIFANNLENLASELNIKGEFIQNENGSMYIDGGDRIDNQSYRDSGGYDYNRFTIYTDVMTYEKPEIAQILSGKDIYFDTNSIRNNYSLISAKNDIYFESNVLSNESIDIVKLITTKKDIYYNEKYCKGWSILGKCTNTGHRSTYSGTQTTYDVNVIDKINSTIEAGGRILGSAGNLINGNENAIIEFTSYNPTTNTDVKSSNLSTSIKNTQNQTVSSNEIMIQTINNNYELPTNKYGMFRTVDPNKNLNYLVESNPLYTNLSNYTGSQYFLDKMNYKSDRVTKRLGDAAYETKLVSQAIIQQTGQRFLNAEYTSENTQFVALMNNAVNLSGILDLEIGQALTQTQLSNLTEDIVWMEEKIVNGQSVLVPVVYLAKDYEHLKGASIVAGNSIDLKVKDSVNNSGNIKSKDYINLSANSITNNAGVILSNGNVRLIADENILNKNGGIIKASDVQIASINGDIINETFSKQNTINNGANNFTYTQIGNQSQIEATNGNLVIQANNNIENIGANLSASKTLSLNAINGDVNLKTIELKKEHNIYYGGGFNKALDIENLPSTASSGESIVIKAGNNINLEAVKLNATNQINLNAANDVNITAVNDEHYKDVQTSSKGFLSKKTQRDMSYKEEVASSELNANDIVINASNNVNLEAAKLKAQDNIIVNAKDGDVNILAKEYREGELHSTKKSSWGGLKKSLDIKSNDALKLNSALLETQAANVVITSGKDINILASEINSGADIQLKALNDVLIASQEEYLKTKEVHEKSSFNIAGLAGLIAPVGGSIYTQEIHKNDKVSSTNKQSFLNAKENIIIDSGTTNIIGSNLEANNIAIKADTGNINILSSQDIKNENSLDKKIEFSLSNPLDIIKNDLKNTLSGQTKIKIELGSLTYEEEAKVFKDTVNTSSNLIANKNIVLDSLDDITIQGSNLKANENIALNSQIGDINILNSIDTSAEDIKEKHAKASVSATVQNEYVEIASAVKAALESAKQLKQTKDDYSKYKGEVKKLENTLVNLKQSYKNKEVGIDYTDIEDLVDIIDNVKSQEKYYVAAIAAASADLASKTVAVVTQGKAAASSIVTWGFSVGMSLDVEGSKTKTNTTSQTSNASNLNAKNIYVNTDETLNTNININITGSNLIAQDNLNINTTNLNVKASQNTITLTQDSKSVNGSVAFTMYGGGGGTAGLGYGQQNSDSNNLINNNSILQANNVNINASNDASFIGANVKANDTLNLNVGNNLVLESLRDEYSSNSNGFNVNAGIGFGSAGAPAKRSPSADVGKQSSTNAGFSVNNGIILNKQTVLSSITGNEVNVNVGNNTHLKGALLASGNFTEDGSFVDNKNLNFTTNTLTFENLSNTTYSSNQSIGGNFNYNLDSTKIVDKKEVPQQGGISSIGYTASNGINLSATKTLATLGQGNINIKDKENSDDLERLNTDTSKINKDLYSSSTGTKVDATLDTRLLTEDGRKQIAEDIERTKRLGQAIGDVVSSNSLTITDTFDHIGNVQKDLDVQKAIALKDKGQTISILENQQNYSQEQIDIALNDYAQIYANVYEVNIENAKMAVLSGRYGSTYTNKDNSNSNVYLDKLNNQNALDTANTLGHEVAHVRQNQGQTYLRDTTQLQEEYANLFSNYSSSGLDFSSHAYNNVKLDSNKTNSLNSINDLYALYQNSVAYKKDVNKADSGDGRIDDSIIVEKIEDNKYKVVDGKLDNDLKVYDENKKVIANTLTKYSGFNEEEKAVIGAIIAFNDKSGKEFLNNLTSTQQNPFTYFRNAGNGGLNDFKTNGVVKGDENYYNGVYQNRFMPLTGTIFVSNNSSIPTIATGRDIGNIGAGYVAGSIFLPWSSTRLGFDGYNFIKNGQLTESPVSKEAQITGFILGNPVYRNISNLSKELKK